MKLWPYVIILILCLGLEGHLAAVDKERQASSDSSKGSASSSDTSVPQEEIILDAIEIKGKVEKPGVIIMPKRIEPELNDIALERSFQREVKESIGEMPKPAVVLQEVDRVKSIKKTVERKRK